MRELVFLSVLLVGCSVESRYAAASSGLVGCAPEDVRVTRLENMINPFVPTTWAAECGGSIYYCSAYRDGGEKISITRFACKQSQRDH